MGAQLRLRASDGRRRVSDHVTHLVLYEPTLGLTYPAGVVEAIESALASDDRVAAIRAALVDTAVMTDEELRALEETPRWAVMLAAAPTLGRECRVEHTWSYAPGPFEAIAAPTLLLTGSDSDDTVRALAHRARAAIPGAQIRVLVGHGHFAHRTDPAMVAAIVRDWTSARRPTHPAAISVEGVAPGTTTTKALT